MSGEFALHTKTVAKLKLLAILTKEVNEILSSM
jgi:hypothetical protein